MATSNPVMWKRNHRSGSDLGSVVREIDESIAGNSQRVLDDISKYFETHREELIQELLNGGKATIKTFAGDFDFSVADLYDALKQQKR